MAVRTKGPQTPTEEAPTRSIGGAVGNRNQERIDRLSSIADQADELRAQEFGDVGDEEEGRPGPEDEEDEEEPTRGQDDVEPDESDQGEDEQEEEESPDTQASAPTRKIKIKVNGRDMELTEQELVERAQKVESADDYLRSASEAFRRSLSQDPPKTVAAQPESDEVDDDDIALARALQMGDEAEAAKAIRRLRKTPSVKPDEITQLIDERTSLHRAFSRFEGEYPEIVGDPRLWRMAQDRDAELVAKGDTRSHYDRMKAVGDELREWTGKLTTPSSQSRDDKKARKGSMSTVTRASGRQAPVSQADDTEENVSTTIQKMAMARQPREVKRR